MKFFKIFKKKVSKSHHEREQSNLVCNIHWAAVQKELAMSTFPPPPAPLLSQQSPAMSWNSEDENSSEGNSWSSISLSSSGRTNTAEVFPEECFSRASSPGTEVVKSSVMDDISLEDVEQFEEKRLAQVRRKVSRVDSLKRFLFSSRLEEKKNKNNSQLENFRRPTFTAIDTGYHPSCLEVHDRWVGIQNNQVEEEEEDNVSRKVNINMDIGKVKESGQHSSGRAVSRSHSQPSHHVRSRLTRREAARTQYLNMTVFKTGEENLGVIITSSSSTNGFIIAHIEPGSVVDRDGRFCTGDKIVSINGHHLLDLTISQVRQILKFSGSKVDIEIIREERPDQQTKLSKSESLRIFRAMPVSRRCEEGNIKTNQTNVVTERIITPGGNLTKTIITIPSQDTWTTVDIDIDTEQEQPVDVHQVKLVVTPHSPELGLVLEGGRSQGIFICDVIAGGLAGGLPYPGLCQGHSQ